MSFMKSVCAVAAMLACGVSFAQAKLEVDIIYLGRQEQPLQPLSLLDTPVEDNGIPGSLLGLRDTQTTGSFLNQFYNMKHVIVDQAADLNATYRDLVANGNKLFIADLNAEDIQSIADIEKDVLIFSIRAKDDVLRNEACHSNIFHFPPSRAMLADALRHSTTSIVVPTAGCRGMPQSAR